MFQRFISAMLIGALTVATCAPAVAEGVTAGDLLFGSGAVTAAQSSAEDLEVDVYGENDEASISAYQTLQLGDRDEADAVAYIVMLQKRLIALGFLDSAADGVFGEATESAVMEFQKLNGLEETGIADEVTQQKLFSDSGAIVTPEPDTPVASGAEAIRVQTKLVEWGFLTGSVDGKLGSTSKTAIQDFKSYIIECDPEVFVTPTPEVTPSPTPEPTLAPGELPSVKDELLETPEPETTYVPDAEVDELLLSYVDGERTFQIYRETVQNGDRGEEVKRVQRRLNQLGYLYNSADGAFGSSTELALKYFQYKHNLSETGIADESTQMVLFSEDVQRSEEYVFPYKLVVDISDQYVYVYKWEGSGYTGKERKMICSTGKDETPTPTGVYQAYGRMTTDEWYYFKTFNCYAKWAYGIVGGILFHSVTFNTQKVLNQGSVNNLGKKASHGCIRLEIDDAKWIYDNCPNGTTVVIQE